MTVSLDSFTSSIASIDGSSFNNEVDRIKAVDAARDLLSRLETPGETALHMIWKLPALWTSLKVALDSGLLQRWHELGNKPMTISELDTLSACRGVLLRRILNHMVAMKTIDIDSDARYTMRQFTSGIGDPNTSLASTLGYLHDVNIPGFGNLPSFLASRDFEDPKDPRITNWHMLSRDHESFFAMIGRDSRIAENFHGTMTFYNSFKSKWVEIYPVQELLEGAKHDRPLVVDIGGSTGLDLLSVVAKCPQLPPTQFVLQDLPEVVNTISPDVKNSITVQTHDMFDPQPVKGARAYYLHIVLHDWADEKAIEIIKSIEKAMEPGYSKLLLHECVVDPQNPVSEVTASDLTMMMAFSAREREKSAWAALLEAGGLKLKRVWSNHSSHESVIEAGH